MGEIAGRRPARQGSLPDGPRRLCGSVSAANRARRREAADGKKLQEKRGHYVERLNIGSVMPGATVAASRSQPPLSGSFGAISMLAPHRNARAKTV